MKYHEFTKQGEPVFTMTNSLGQVIAVYDHHEDNIQSYGLAVCHALKVCELIREHGLDAIRAKEYELLFVDNVLRYELDDTCKAVLYLQSQGFDAHIDRDNGEGYVIARGNSQLNVYLNQNDIDAHSQQYDVELGWLLHDEDHLPVPDDYETKHYILVGADAVPHYLNCGFDSLHEKLYKATADGAGVVWNIVVYDEMKDSVSVLLENLSGYSEFTEISAQEYHVLNEVFFKG